MITKRHLALAGIILLAVISMNACAPSVYERPKVDRVWPLPPEKPRIKFVDRIASTRDLGKESSISDALFGDEKIEGLAKPYGITVDKEGKIYVTHIGKVTVFDIANKDYDFIGDTPGSGNMEIPIGITAARDGRIFVTDVSANRVFVYLNGAFVTALGKSGELENPSGVALDESRGLIYVVDSKKHVINVYSLGNYSLLRTIGARGEDQGQFNYPTNITVDREGTVYVSDTGNFRIQIFDPDGNFVKSIGQLGDAPGSLARPKGIAVDSEGHIYVVDTAFQNFQIFNQEGQILLYVGEAGVGPGKFLIPAGMFIDDSDRIYVVDQIPGSFQIFQFLGGD